MFDIRFEDNSMYGCCAVFFLNDMCMCANLLDSQRTATEPFQVLGYVDNLESVKSWNPLTYAVTSAIPPSSCPSVCAITHSTRRETRPETPRTQAFASHRHFLTTARTLYRTQKE